MPNPDCFFETPRAYISKNPLSQALRRIKCDTWFFLSGQLGFDPESGKLVSGGVRAETRRTMENIKAILEDGGSSLRNVVKMTIFHTELSADERAALNEEYQLHFEKPYPTRSMVEVSGLAAGAKVEIECIAIDEPAVG